MARLRLFALASAIAISATQPALAKAADAHHCAAGVTTLSPEPVWDGTPPDMATWGGRLDTPVEESATPDGDNLFNVTDPTYQAFLPAADCATGAAVVVVPGGGFRLLSINHEGKMIARWLAERGVAAFVVKYRLVQYAEPSLTQPVRRDLPMDVQSAAAINDSRQTVERVRSQANRFGIDPDRTGTIGFSAGGYAVVAMGVDDEAAKRPSFVGNIYGAYFEDRVPKLPSAAAPDSLPPFFLAMARDDYAVSRGFYDLTEALLDAGYEPEAHFYAKGKHGFGGLKRGLSTDLMMDEYLAWIGTIGMLDAPEEAAQPEE